jgi:hypothetical protein
MSSVIAALDAALYSQLNHSSLTSLLGGSAKIYYGLAPKGVALPYVIFQWQGGGEENLTKKRMRALLYVVRAVASSKSAASALDTQIDGRMTKASLTVTGWSSYVPVKRAGDVNYVEPDEAGNLIYHIGAIYHIRLSE